MIGEIDDIISDYVFEQGNTKVRRNESLDSYLSSLTCEELSRFICVTLENDETIRTIKSKTKKDKIKYIKNNLKTILEEYVRILDTASLNGIKKVVSKSGYLKIKREEIDFSLNFILEMKKFSLAKVYYNKEKDTIEIYMPKGFVDALKLSLNKKRVMNYNKDFNEYMDYVENVLDTYGVVSYDFLYELFSEQIKEIDYDELIDLILKASIVRDSISLTNYNINELLINHIEFSNDDEVLSFYEKSKGEYHKYSKDEILSIGDTSYFDSLPSYKSFVEYLSSTFIDVFDDIDDFIKNFIVVDYYFSAQLNVKLADKNLMSHIDNMFEVTKKDRKIMKNMVKKIFDESPKWIKRGNI